MGPLFCNSCGFASLSGLAFYGSRSLHLGLSLLSSGSKDSHRQENWRHPPGFWCSIFPSTGVPQEDFLGRWAGGRWAGAPITKGGNALEMLAGYWAAWVGGNNIKTVLILTVHCCQLGFVGSSLSRPLPCDIIGGFSIIYCYWKL